MPIKTGYDEKFSFVPEPTACPRDYMGVITNEKADCPMKQPPEHDAILSCYDDLLRLALSKCHHQQDAEDLVSETMLAAYAYLHRGGVIDYPRTWLANTLMHKYNSALRKKYRAPVLVSPDVLFGMADDSEARAEEAFFATKEATRLRRELCYLGELHRKVLLRHYFYGESVAEIAQALQIPQGTVKSRLSAGREALRVRMKKGMDENMENQKCPIPGRLEVQWSGSAGPQAISTLVNGNLIAENLLILAYKAPLTLPELADAIGIPTVYIEPIVRKLVEAELMAETESGKVYTNFMIYFPDTDRVYALYKEQIAFADKYSEGLGEVIRRLTGDLADFAEALPAERRLSSRAAMKLERYAVTKALQIFVLFGQSRYRCPTLPKRRADGGHWLAFGWASPGDHKTDERMDEMQAYHLYGHRTSGLTRKVPIEGTSVEVHLHEYDTAFWDCRARYHGACDINTYFEHIHHFLYRLHKSLPMEDVGFPSNLMEGIPQLIEWGVLTRDGDRLLPDIPILTEEEYTALESLIQKVAEGFKTTIGAPFHEYLAGAAEWVPPHLDQEAVPNSYRYHRATMCFVMAAVRKAHDLGIHMKGVDYCCPPMVLTYRENM